MIFSKLEIIHGLHTFFNLLNHPSFYLEEMVGNLVRGCECFVGLSILLVYDLYE